MSNVANSRSKLKNFKAEKARAQAMAEEKVEIPVAKSTTRMDISKGTANSVDLDYDLEATNAYAPGNVIDTFDDFVEEPVESSYIDESELIREPEPVKHAEPKHSSIINAREVLQAKREADVNGADFDIVSVQTRKLKPKNVTNVKEFELNVFNVKPVTISRIIDTEGQISAAVRDIEDASGISVLPFPIAQLLPQVEELSGHKIMMIRGEKYVSGTTRIVSKGRFDTYVTQIKEEIMKGRIYDESLLEEVTYAGQSFITMKFNHYELSMLNSMFINIQFLVYEDSLGDIRINVGGYTV